MKKGILIAVFMSLVSHIGAQKSFYEQIQETDSILSVYTEKDTININSVFLVFENKSSDSIILVSTFENFLSEFKYSPGFQICFYFNQELGFPTWGELYPDYYTFSNGRTFISPHEKIRFPIELPYIGKIRDDIEKGVVFEIFYRYFNETKRRASNYCMRTNYLNLEYLKKFDSKSE